MFKIITEIKHICKGDKMKETSVGQRVLLEAAQNNILLMRNNNGACQDATGRFIRYGLLNESAKMNEHMKSSDYVGIAPTLITPEMVGRVVGVFVGIETKASMWHFNQMDERAVAQQRFIDLVRSYGGYAGFATGPEDVRRITGR